MTVKVDKDVLAATVIALDDLSYALPDLMSRADRLGAGTELAGLRGADQWAVDTARDLQARIGVLEQMAQANPSFAGVRMSGDQALEIAGQSMRIEDAALALEVADTPADAWTEDPANLSEWFEQLQARALQKLTGMSDAEQAEKLVDAYNDVQNLVVASVGTTAAVSQVILKGGPALVRWMAQRGIVDPGLNALVASGRPGLANWLSGALNAADANYINGKTQFTRPGAFVPNLTQKLLLRTASTVEDFDAWVQRTSQAVKPYQVAGQTKPTLLAKLLTSRPGVASTTWVSSILKTTSTGQLATRLAGWGNNVFGRPWTNTVTGVTYGRGAGNLLTMANPSGLRTMASSAGALRVLGVAGSGLATVDGVVGLVNNWDEHGEMWENGGTEGKAHVIGEYAETAFNASMTAALIAPNPVTLGLVAVTGLVWAGAEVVEHWDDITAAVDDAADWVGDRADDAADWAGDRLDDIKESDLNPMNWF